MSARVKKILLLLLAVALLVGVSFVQRTMNRDRDRLGLTHAEVLKNAPPVLAFTTVALGGFRGLIANALWIRAQDLQQDDKFFEMAQLADWITKLEPHFVQVWIFQEWNMAWNISVKFKDFEDRWHWVQRGIELIRDEGLQYNPNEPLMFRELAWIFQNKIGASTDDASMFYKRAWAREMMNVLGARGTNLNELINPQTDDAKARAKLLVEKYKLDPAFMKKVDELHGPLEWRLPEAHALYWAEKALDALKGKPELKEDDLLPLRRVVYQSMQLAFQRGHLVTGPFTNTFNTSPNLDIIRKAADAYEYAMDVDRVNSNNIVRAYRNLMRDAVYFLYLNNRVSQSAEWYKKLGTKFPNDQLLDGQPETRAATMTLEAYVFARTGTDVKETDPNRVRSAVNGMLVKSYQFLVSDEDDQAAGYRQLAYKIWNTYQSKISAERQDATGLPPFETIDKEVRDMLLDPERGWPEELRAILRVKLGMEPEAPAASASTSAPAATTIRTNTPTAAP